MRFKPKLVLIAACFLAAVTVAHAQSAVPDPIQYLVAPETPGPNQQVFITVQGVGSFEGDATITWFVNGKVMDSGVGHGSFSFTTGAVGSATSVRVTVDSPTQGSFSHTFVFAPSVVDLVWEADTSAPLFYQGKTLYSPGAHLTVVAFPSVAVGRSLAPIAQLSFKWFVGDTPMPDQSGMGRNTLSFNGDQLQQSESVSVDVYLSGAKVGHGDITIPASSPQVLLYAQDPLRGELVDHALTNTFNLTTNEITLRAEPYFFANSSLHNGSLAYTWTLNGQETTGPQAAQGLLTLRQTGQGGGSGVIGVALQNTETDKFIQTANTTLQILFGQQTGSSVSSFFGL